MLLLIPILREGGRKVESFGKKGGVGKAHAGTVRALLLHLREEKEKGERREIVFSLAFTVRR